MTKKGFSLVEFIIYFGIFSFVAVILITLLVTTVRDRGHVESRTEVQQNIRYAITRMTQAIHASTGVNGTPGASLSLAMATGAINPTVFDLSSGALRITEGAGAAVALTSDNVTVSALTFTKISNPAPAKASVQISITVAYKDNGNPQLIFSQTQITTATLRQ